MLASALKRASSWEEILLSTKPKMFEDTRTGLLKLGATWIATRSYHGTSLSELLRVTGVGKGGFYHHFSSKEQLLMEIMLAPIERVIASGREIIEGDGSASARLVALGEDFGRSVGEDLDSWVVFLREYSALSPESKEHVLGRRSEYLAQWYRIVEVGQRNGEFRQIDRSFVESILGIFVYTFVWSAESKSSSDLISSVTELLLHGLEQRS